MKFGAVAVIIGVVVIIIGFAAPTMQIVTAVPYPLHSLQGSTSVSQSMYYSGQSIPLKFTWTEEFGSPIAIWEVISSGGTTHVFSRMITTQSGSYIYTWNGASPGQSYVFKITYLRDAPNLYVTIGDSSFSVSNGNPQSISAPTVISASATPNPAKLGQNVTFNSDINWNGQTGYITWYVNGDFINGNTYIFHSSGTYNISVGATNSEGTTYKYLNEVIEPSITAPTIETASGSPNPATVGQTVTFTSNIFWNGQTGSTIWEVNGNTITGNSYIFNSEGTYVITVEASNSAGTTYKSFNEVVNSNSTIQTSNNTTPILKNVGIFYVVSNGTSYNLEDTSNVNITATTYPSAITIYYVENHGNTQNLSGISIIIDSNTYTLSLQNKTTYDGYNALAMQVNLQQGNYTFGGYLYVVNNPTPIQAFSLIVHNVPVPPSIIETLIYHINYIAVIIGILVMIVGVVLIRFGI